MGRLEPAADVAFGRREARRGRSTAWSSAPSVSSTAVQARRRDELAGCSFAGDVRVRHVNESSAMRPPIGCRRPAARPRGCRQKISVGDVDPSGARSWRGDGPERPAPTAKATTMTTTNTSRTVSPASTGTCDPETRVTRSLLGYGVLAGPVYVTASLVQAVTRPDFDLSRHEWSLLATGPHGWIQIANLALTGGMVLAFAVGLRRALAGGSGARWAPRLVGVYGACLVAAAFRADPAFGFPAGTPAGP